MRNILLLSCAAALLAFAGCTTRVIRSNSFTPATAGFSGAPPVNGLNNYHPVDAGTGLQSFSPAGLPGNFRPTGGF